MSGAWTFVWVLLGLVILYGGLAALITAFQRKLIYKPDPRRTTPEQQGLEGVEAFTLATGDGNSLAVWAVAPRPGYPTLLYLHGNAGWIELRSERLTALRARGFGVVMPSYRGYGGSTGLPSERANVADACAVYDAVRARGVAVSDLILFGESLGTGIATQVAAKRPCAALVLDSPYTSMTDLAGRRYPWLPVRRLLLDHYDTHRFIRQVLVPVLVLHGAADDLVPVSMGVAVHDAAPGAKTIMIYEDAPHLDHLAAGSMEDVARFIARCRAGRPVPPSRRIKVPGQRGRLSALERLKARASKRKRPGPTPEPHIA